MKNSRYIAIYLLLACAISLAVSSTGNAGQDIDTPGAKPDASDDEENCQNLLGNDSTTAAKRALVQFFKDDPHLSVDKKWKRLKKWKVGNRVYRSFRSENGQEALVVFDPVTKTNSVSLDLPAVKPRMPPHHFLFAIDNAGMSADESGGPSVVIVAREQFEEIAWVEDHMESSDRELLDPVLVELGLTENMSNEFQARGSDGRHVATVRPRRQDGRGEYSRPNTAVMNTPTMRLASSVSHAKR